MILKCVRESDDKFSGWLPLRGGKIAQHTTE
jgi:hypothetical protein